MKRKLFILEKLRIGDIVRLETGRTKETFQCIQIPITRVSARSAYSDMARFPIEFDPLQTFKVGNFEWTWTVYGDR
jgi:hypothetical protein